MKNKPTIEELHGRLNRVELDFEVLVSLFIGGMVHAMGKEQLTGLIRAIFAQIPNEPTKEHRFNHWLKAINDPQSTSETQH